MDGIRYLVEKPTCAMIRPNIIDRLNSTLYSKNRIETRRRIVDTYPASAKLSSLVAIRNSRRLPNGEDELYLGLEAINSETGEITPRKNKEQGITGLSVVINSENILFSRLRPNLNKVAICPKNIKNIIGSTELAVLESTNVVDNYFLFTVLKSKIGYNQVVDIPSGSTLPRIQTDDILDILVPIPSPEIQKYIGDKVRKAEKLRGEVQIMKNKSVGILNKYLEEPKISERSYSISLVERTDLSNRIDAEFYGQEYLESIKSLKTKYELISLEKICNGKIFNGKTYITSSDRSSLQNIGVGELGDWFPKRNEDKGINEKVSAKNILPYGSIVWGNAAHLARYIGQKVNIILEGNRFVGTTEITSIFPDENIISPYFVFLFMNSGWGYYQIQRTIKGMTAHSYPDDIRNVLVPIINFTQDELREMKSNIINAHTASKYSQELIDSAMLDIEDLIEGKFEINKEYLNLIE